MLAPSKLLIHPRDFQATKIHVPKIAIAEIRFFASLKTRVEFGDLPLTEQLIHRVSREFWLHGLYPFSVKLFRNASDQFF